MTQTINIGKVVEVPQLYMAKEEACICFGYKNHRPTFQKLLREFKEHPKFAKGYRLSTSGVPTVHIQLFDDFLSWRDENKYKRKKDYS